MSGVLHVTYHLHTFCTCVIWNWLACIMPSYSRKCCSHMINPNKLIFGWRGATTTFFDQIKVNYESEVLSINESLTQIVYKNWNVQFCDHKNRTFQQAGVMMLWYWLIWFFSFLFLPFLFFKKSKCSTTVAISYFSLNSIVTVG